MFICFVWMYATCVQMPEEARGGIGLEFQMVLSCLTWFLVQQYTLSTMEPFLQPRRTRFKWSFKGGQRKPSREDKART